MAICTVEQVAADSNPGGAGEDSGAGAGREGGHEGAGRSIASLAHAQLANLLGV